MHMTAQQLTAFKASILTNTATIPAGQPFAGVQVKDVPNNPDGNLAVAGWYNLVAAPAFTLWRKAVPLAEIAVSLNGTELAGLSTLNHTRLQTVITLVNASGGANPSVADQRAFWNDIFSGAGGTNTRAALLVIWKRLASNIEKLFATGTGSDAVPAISAFPDGSQADGRDVNSALNLP